MTEEEKEREETRSVPGWACVGLLKTRERRKKEKKKTALLGGRYIMAKVS